MSFGGKQRPPELTYCISPKGTASRKYKEPPAVAKHEEQLSKSIESAQMKVQKVRHLRTLLAALSTATETSLASPRHARLLNAGCQMSFIVKEKEEHALISYDERHGTRAHGFGTRVPLDDKGRWTKSYVRERRPQVEVAEAGPAGAAMRAELGGQKLSELWERKEDASASTVEVMNRVRTICKSDQGVFNKSEFDHAVHTLKGGHELDPANKLLIPLKEALVDVVAKYEASKDVLDIAALQAAELQLEALQARQRER